MNSKDLSKKETAAELARKLKDQNFIQEADNELSQMKGNMIRFQSMMANFKTIGGQFNMYPTAYGYNGKRIHEVANYAEHILKSITANQKSISAVAKLTEAVKVGDVVDQTIQDRSKKIMQQGLSVGKKQMTAADIAKDLAKGLTGKEIGELKESERSQLFEKARQILQENKNGFASREDYLKHLQSTNTDFDPSLVGEALPTGSQIPSKPAPVVTPPKQTDTDIQKPADNATAPSPGTSPGKRFQRTRLYTY